MADTRKTPAKARAEQRPDGPPISFSDRPARPDPPARVKSDVTFSDTPVRAVAVPRPVARHDSAPAETVAAGRLGPQEGAPSIAAANRDDGYVRLTVHVENGTLTVTDARDIEGEIAEELTVGDGLAHEARLGDRRVALGTTPDVGVNRSIEKIGSDGPREHRIEELASYDFFVRLPRRAIAGADISQLKITHVEIANSARKPLDNKPLEQQKSLTVRRVGAIEGLKIQELPDHVRSLIARPIPQ